MIPKISLAFLLLTFAFVACNSDSTSSVNTTSGSMPTAGSRYVYLDSSTGFAVPPSDITYLVVQSSGNMFAWRQDTAGNRYADSTRFWYKLDANGNLEEDPWPLNVSRSGWFTMPYITKGLFSSTELDGADTVKTSAIGETTDGTFTLAGKQYTTKRVKLTVTTVQQGGASQTNVYHYQYSPDLGVEVAYDEDDWNIQGAVQEAHHFKLTAIDRK